MRICLYCLIWSLLGLGIISFAMFRKLVVPLKRSWPLEEGGGEGRWGQQAVDPLAYFPNAWPVNQKTRISSSFGMRKHPIFQQRRMHRGIDFALPMGTPVLATATGQVEEIMTSPHRSTYGRYVLICHDEEYSSLYAHLSKVQVAEGELIQKGDTIALSGNSGLSTSPHLHYEVLQNQRRVNPRHLLPLSPSSLANQ